MAGRSDSEQQPEVTTDFIGNYFDDIQGQYLRGILQMMTFAHAKALMRPTDADSSQHALIQRLHIHDRIIRDMKQHRFERKTEWKAMDMRHIRQIPELEEKSPNMKAIMRWILSHLSMGVRLSTVNGTGVTSVAVKSLISTFQDAAFLSMLRYGIVICRRVPHVEIPFYPQVVDLQSISRLEFCYDEFGQTQWRMFEKTPSLGIGQLEAKTATGTNGQHSSTDRLIDDVFLIEVEAPDLFTFKLNSPIAGLIHQFNDNKESIYTHRNATAETSRSVYAVTAAQIKTDLAVTKRNIETDSTSRVLATPTRPDLPRPALQPPSMNPFSSNIYGTSEREFGLIAQQMGGIQAMRNQSDSKLAQTLEFSKASVGDRAEEDRVENAANLFKSQLEHAQYRTVCKAPGLEVVQTDPGATMSLLRTAHPPDIRSIVADYSASTRLAFLAPEAIFDPDPRYQFESFQEMLRIMNYIRPWADKLQNVLQKAFSCIYGQWDRVLQVINDETTLRLAKIKKTVQAVIRDETTPLDQAFADAAAEFAVQDVVPVDEMFMFDLNIVDTYPERMEELQRMQEITIQIDKREISRRQRAIMRILHELEIELQIQKMCNDILISEDDTQPKKENFLDGLFRQILAFVTTKTVGTCEDIKNLTDSVTHYIRKIRTEQKNIEHEFNGNRLEVMLNFIIRHDEMLQVERTLSEDRELLSKIVSLSACQDTWGYTIGPKRMLVNWSTLTDEQKALCRPPKTTLDTTPSASSSSSFSLSQISSVQSSQSSVALPDPSDPPHHSLSLKIPPYRGDKPKKKPQEKLLSPRHRRSRGRREAASPELSPSSTSTRAPWPRTGQTVDSDEEDDRRPRRQKRRRSVS